MAWFYPHIPPKSLKKKDIRLLGRPSLFPEFWWRITDSNRGHKDYDSSALTD